MKKMVNGVIVECVKGDITRQKGIDAIVNAANAQLCGGGGVAGAVHRAAGSKMASECATLAPIKPGEAVITAGYGLPNRHVIHCLGPVYGVDEPAATILADCYRSALRIAEQNKISSIAFPAISTGIFGYPIEEASEVAIKTVLSELPGLRQVKRVRFVLYDQKDLTVYSTVLGLLLVEARKT